MQAHERSLQIEITVAALVVGTQVDIVETIVSVCHFHSENGRLQMVDMRVDVVFVALDGIVSLNVHADVRIVDGGEPFHESMIVLTVQTDIAETVFVVVESADFTFRHQIVLIAFHLDGSSHLSEGLVGKNTVEGDSLGSYFSLNIFAVLGKLDVSISSARFQSSLRTELVAVSAEVTHIVDAAETGHFFRNIDFLT